MDEKIKPSEKKSKRIIEEESPPDSGSESDYEESEYETENDSDYEDSIDLENSNISKIIKDILKKKSEIVFNIFPGQNEDFESHEILKTPEVIELSEEGKKMKEILDAKQKEVNDFNMLNNPLKLTNTERILMANIDNGTKSSILDKIKTKSNGDEGAKTDQWVENFLKIPFNNYKSFGLESSDKTSIQNFLVNLKKNLDKSVYGMEEVKNEIMSFVVKKIINPDSKGSILALQGPKGTAKCLDPETLVLKFDGKLVKAKELVTGDILMGDDSKPRFITGTASGDDDMYTINPEYGNSYKVNKEHILCLKNVFTKEVKEISVKKYLEKSNIFKRIYKGYHVPVEYKYKDIKQDPYILGKKFKKEIPKSILTNNIVTRKLYLQGICGFRLGFYKKDQKITIKVSESSDLERLIWSLGYTIIEITKNSLTFVAKSLLEKINVVYNGKGKYFGFELTGNGRFLFKDNTVSHNTRIARKGIAESLNIPFHSINFGGMKDSSLLVGHDLTYVGSSYGKICQILINSGCMNPIIYLDECFPRCQKVITEDGTETIGNLYDYFKSGKEVPLVQSFNEETKTFEYKRIINVWEKNNNNLLELSFGNFKTKCTENHLFLTENGWIKAKELTEKDNVISKNDDEYYSITNLTCKKDIKHEDGKVYDIEVEDNHNFLISSSSNNKGIVVHNCDKVSGEHARDIFGVLTHLLDEEQNKEFEDNYFKGIKIDLSKALFIISFNDIEQIDHIAADRMRIIKITPPTIKEKIKILENILIPEINEANKNNNLEIIINEEMIKYILNLTEKEDGMRKVRENIKKILERINLCWYSGGSYLPEVYKIIETETSKTDSNSSHKAKKIKVSKTKIIINKEIVDKIISKIELSNNHSHMYI